MAKKRGPRLNEQVRRELTQLIQFEVRDPRINMVTVTDVEVSPDLYHAKVFVSILGEAEEKKSAMEGLRAASGFLRTEIAKRIHVRKSPELHFTLDETIEHAMNIERLLKEARAGMVTEPDSDASDTTTAAESAAPDEKDNDDG